VQFAGRKRRKPPTVILVALIDVLVVVLIFMMVATTFKAHPALRLVLPESRQAGTPSEAKDLLVVTISKEAPYLYLGQTPITYENLRAELKASASQQPGVSLAIRPDEEAPVGQVVRVLDAAKEAGIKKYNMQVRTPGQP
jgi:biopolymer transport protein ExbD